MIRSSRAMRSRSDASPASRFDSTAGSTGRSTSPTRNRVPVTLLDVRLQPGAGFEQVLPASYNGFAYVLAGEARVGSRDTALVPGQVGWLDRPTARGDSRLVLANHGTVPMRLLLYAGEPQNVPLATYGPFIGETREDIVRSMKRYGTGSFRRY